MPIQAGAPVDVADFAITDWSDLDGLVETGYSSTSLEVSRAGSSVFWEGDIVPATDWGAINSLHTVLSADVPALFRPRASLLFLQPSVGGTAGVAFRVTVNASGSVQVRCSAASYTGGVYMSMTYRGAPL